MRKLVVFLGLSAATMFMSAQQFSVIPCHTIRYVTQNGAGNFSGTSWANASPDLQDMINKGGQVWVAAGVYVPQRRIDNIFGPLTPGNNYNSFVLHDGVELYGGFAGWETLLEQRDCKQNITVLDGYMGNGIPCSPKCPNDHVYHVVVIAGIGNAVLDGFTVKNGFASLNNSTPPQLRGIPIYEKYGGGLFVSVTEKTKLKNLIIEENDAIYLSGHGGGIFIDYPQMFAYNMAHPILLQNAIIRHNTAGSGGGIFAQGQSEPIFINILINNNIATDITPFLSYGGGGICFDLTNSPWPAPALINVTLANNTSDLLGDDGITVYHTNVQFYNCIIWNNILFPPPSSVSFDHCLVMNMNPPGNGNLDGTPANGVVPDFVNPSNYDYRLSPTSPCIDAGSQNLIGSAGYFINQYMQYMQVDLDGNKRVQGIEIDMGCYESESNFEGKTIRYVTPIGAGTKNGSSWNDASDDLQDMINQSIYGDQVWVALGEYMPKEKDTIYPVCDRPNPFTLQEGVEVYGGFAGWESQLDERDWQNNSTVLNGLFYSRVVAVVGINDAVLDGFTIKNGNSCHFPRSGGIIVSSASNTKLKNLIVKNNSAGDGGGISIENSHDLLLQNIILRNNSGGGILIINSQNAMFQNITLYENHAGNGGAIYAENANLTLVNVLCYNNTAHEGAGLFLRESYPLLINVTIAENNGGIGIVSERSQSIIYNSIIWDDINITDAHSGGCDFVIDYSLVRNMVFPGSNNLDGTAHNPDFDNDYHLSQHSPCIDAGNQNYVNLYTQIDLDRNYRVHRANVDMGAYEYDSPPAPHNLLNRKSANGSKDMLESEIEKERLNLSVYPNPTSNQLTISFPPSETSASLSSQGGAKVAGNAEYNIYSVVGQVVMQGRLQGNTINVESLSNGMYFLKIDNKVVKFVKQ